MSNEIDHQSNVDRIYQSVEEVSALLSALEAKIRVGLTQVQTELEPPEISGTDEPGLMLEDASCLTSWF